MMDNAADYIAIIFLKPPFFKMYFIKQYKKAINYKKAFCFGSDVNYSF